MSEPSLNLRLRARKEFVLNGTWMMSREPDRDCTEAADEIERLEKIVIQQQLIIGTSAAKDTASNREE
jgi:hypothetical protein